MADTNTSAGGIGVAGLLGVVFVTLKIIAIEPVASWPWLWVLAPFWIPLAGGLGIALLIVLAVGARQLWRKAYTRSSRKSRKIL